MPVIRLLTRMMVSFVMVGLLGMATLVPLVRADVATPMSEDMPAGGEVGTDGADAATAASASDGDVATTVPDASEESVFTGSVDPSGSISGLTCDGTGTLTYANVPAGSYFALQSVYDGIGRYWTNSPVINDGSGTWTFDTPDYEDWGGDGTLSLNPVDVILPGGLDITIARVSVSGCKNPATIPPTATSAPSATTVPPVTATATSSPTTTTTPSATATIPPTASATATATPRTSPTPAGDKTALITLTTFDGNPIPQGVQVCDGKGRCDTLPSGTTASSYTFTISGLAAGETYTLVIMGLYPYQAGWSLDLRDHQIVMPAADGPASASKSISLVESHDGMVVFEFVTNDGGNIPAGTQWCLFGLCQTFSTAMPSGTRTNPQLILSAWFDIAVVNASPYDDVHQTFGVTARELNVIRVVLNRTDTPTPPSPTPEGNKAAAIVLQTEDHGAIPHTATVCVGSRCQLITDVYDTDFYQFVIDGLAAGRVYPVTVTGIAPYTIGDTFTAMADGPASYSIQMPAEDGGDGAMLGFTLVRTASPTPATTVPATVTPDASTTPEPTAGVTETVRTVVVSTDVPPTERAVSLPNTGVGPHPGQNPLTLLVLMLAGATTFVAVAYGRRRTHQ